MDEGARRAYQGALGVLRRPEDVLDALDGHLLAIHRIDAGVHVPVRPVPDLPAARGAVSRGGGGLQTAESSHFSTRNRSPISRGVGLGKDNDMGACHAPEGVSCAPPALNCCEARR